MLPLLQIGLFSYEKNFVLSVFYNYQVDVIETVYSISR